MRKVAGFIKGTKSNLSSCEGAVEHRKSRSRFLVQKNLGRPCDDIAYNSHIVPGAVWERRSGIQARDPPAVPAVNNEYTVMDGYFRPGILRKVNIVEVKRIYVVENHNH